MSFPCAPFLSLSKDFISNVVIFILRSGPSCFLSQICGPTVKIRLIQILLRWSRKTSFLKWKYHHFHVVMLNSMLLLCSISKICFLQIFLWWSQMLYVLTVKATVSILVCVSDIMHAPWLFSISNFAISITEIVPVMKWKIFFVWTEMGPPFLSWYVYVSSMIYVPFVISISETFSWWLNVVLFFAI